MAYANSCHNSQTRRATNMRGWWVLLLASVCLGDECSDIPCEVTRKNVCGYDEVNNLNAFFITNCVMEQCNCRYDAVESSARFVEQDAGNCTKDPYVTYIDECSAENSSEGSPEMGSSSSEEEVPEPKDSEIDLLPEDSSEDDEVGKVEDILDTSKDENIPVLSIVPPKQIDPVEVSEEVGSESHQVQGPVIVDVGREPPPPVLSILPPKQIDPVEVSEEVASGSHQEPGPVIIDIGRDRPPLPPPLLLGKLGSMILQGLAGNLENDVERKHRPSGQTIIEADINVNVYIDEKMPFPPHHKHHGHHPHEQEDSQEMSDEPTIQVKVPMPLPESEVPNWPRNKIDPMPFEESELPIPSAVQYATAGSATPKLDVLAMLLTSILAMLWGRY